MKIEDLVQLLNNRLREFNLSRSYAVMSGDLDRVNETDEEINGLKDTLYKLNLLVDATETAVTTDTSITEVIADSSPEIVNGYDITLYATDPLHKEKITNILNQMGVMDTAEKIDDYISSKYENSPVTGEMVINTIETYIVDTRLTMALMELDSRFGTVGLATSTLNPGNVGNDDDGNTRTYGSWQEGVDAVAEWLSRHRVTATASSTSETTPTETATTTDSSIWDTVISTLEATSTEATTITPETASSTSETTPTETATTTSSSIWDTVISTLEATPTETASTTQQTTTQATTTSN